MKVHLLRSSLPWRKSPALTECGRDPHAVKAACSRSQLSAMLQALQAPPDSVCEVCRSKAIWPGDMLTTLRREIDRHEAGGRLARELRAMAELVRLYPEDFEALMVGKLAPMRRQIEEAFERELQGLVGGEAPDRRVRRRSARGEGESMSDRPGATRA